MSGGAPKFANAPLLEGAELKLRPWRAEDLSEFAAMSADPEVMRHFPNLLSRSESDAFVANLQERFERWGFGFWALETPEFPFAGFVGLSRPAFDAHFTPAVEIGWRLRRDAWGKGLATAGAKVALAFGFERAGLHEIVALAPKSNTPSRAVMRRLGMSHDPADDFDHPALAGHPALQRCVLYRISRADWACGA
jgi:RimJ/RimL family protein N-acetyltransferase